MPDPVSRPFTLADAMFLVAGTTPGLILLRIGAGFGLFSDEPSPRNPAYRIFVGHLSFAGACVLFSLALSVLILTDRRPRPSRSEVVGGPGFVACLAVLAASILPLAHFATDAAFSHGLIANLVVPYANMFGRLVSGASPMIAGAWLALALAGRWRLQPTWTDRIGCVVGACWVLLSGFIEVYFISLPLWWGV